MNTSPTRVILAADPDTLTAVLRDAPDGAEIQLAPGRYAGPLNLTRSIDILGPEGGRESVVISSDQSPVVILADPGASLCRVRVELRGQHERASERWAIRLDRPGTLVEVAVEAKHGSGVAVMSGAAALIDDLVVRRASRFGLAFFPRSEGRVTNVRIHDAHIAGLVVRSGATPEISGLDIDGAGRTGVAFGPAARGIISDATIDGYRNGLRVSANSDPIIRGMRIHGGVSALVFLPAGRGDLYDIGCQSQTHSAVRIGTDADPRIEGLSVDGERHAILAHDGARGTILDSALSAPVMTSIVYAGVGATTSFVRGRWQGGHHGLLAMGARVRLQRIRLTDQGGCGIDARDGAIVQAIGVRCERAGLVGLCASDGAVIRAAFGEIRAATLSGVLAIGGVSAIEMDGVTIADSGRAGVEVGPGAQAFIRRGMVSDTKFVGLFVKPGGKLVAQDTIVRAAPLGLGALYGATVEERSLVFDACTHDRASETILDAADRIAGDAAQSDDETTDES